MNRCFCSSYFLTIILLTLPPICEYMNIHAASGLCTHGVSYVGGVTAAKRARLNSSDGGVSLRAIWDTGQVRHIYSADNDNN